MSYEFQFIFARLKRILEKHARVLTVEEDKPNRYELAADAGPAIIEAWGRNKVARPMLPVAWLRMGRPFVSYHLFGIHGEAKLLAGMSNELRARMHGKSCFNFRIRDEALFKELERLTAQSIIAYRKAGFITRRKPARPGNPTISDN